MNKEQKIDEKLKELAENSEYLSALSFLLKEQYQNILPSKIWDEVRDKIKEDPKKLEKLEGCKFKFDSLKYHLYRMRIEEENYAKKQKDIYELNNKFGIPMPLCMAIDATNVRIEFESFLLKAKACLEIFIQIVAIEFKNKTHRVAELKKILCDFSKKDKRASLILERLEKAKWLEDFEPTDPYETMRDIIAHISSLAIHPQNALPTPEGIKLTMSGAKKKDERITNIEYATDILAKIDSLITDVFKIIYW